MVLTTHADAKDYYGKASWYGPRFHGHKTASGERYNMYAATCASKVFKFGTVVKVVNLKNHRSALCRVNDRGPYRGGRIIDVSSAVADVLQMKHAGVVPVKVSD